MRVVDIDRSGAGQSPRDGEPPSPERVVGTLHRLLSEVEVGPPYVLVGHSWGGALVRYFAGTYPEEVGGLLYLDPTDIMQSPADELSVFESIGVGCAVRNAFCEAYARATLARRLVNLESWVNVERGGELVLLEGAGHFVHMEEPEAVVSAIMELVP